MPQTELLQYWPDEQALAECLKLEAESASKAIALAVHQPMQFERRVVGAETRDPELCDEHALLRTFLATHLTEGRVILPIVGSSGTGKSHVVRWLGTQLEQHEGHENRIVIQIPKGSSLKSVLGRLLDHEHLQHAVYAPFREKLQSAQEELDPDQAAGMLCEMLAQTLEADYERAREVSRSSPADADAKQRIAFCNPDTLPALLRYQLLRNQYFVHTSRGESGVVRRLVEHFTADRHAAEDDDRQHLFAETDLEFLGIEDAELGRAELRAIQRFQGNKSHRETAVRYLNEALDEAKRRLMRLDPTITELFVAIRKNLLADQKELVLLVEDFAVLSGLQGQLLQVIIQEAVRDGVQILCTMRTALAYTTGYPVPATVMTRAGTEFRIPDTAGSDDTLFQRVERLVGAYLNAARIGRPQLERALDSHDFAASEDLRAWIPSFDVPLEADSRATLDAFGRSQDGYPLFPFNRESVEELSREGCTEGGKLVYNPRLVIRNVLGKVLLSRSFYVEGKFLTVALGAPGRPLAAPVTSHVEQRVPREQFAAYVRFLTYWGGSPHVVAEIEAIPERVFAAFGLAKKSLVAGGAPRPGTAPGARTRDPAPTPSSPSPTETMHPVEAEWRKTLEDWRRGVRIPQNRANDLRKIIAEALTGFIDWDWDLHRPLKDVSLASFFTYVFIPLAGGGEGHGPEEAMIEVCTEADLQSDLESTRVYGALMSLIQFHRVHEGSWNFEGAEESLPRYTAFLESVQERAREFVRTRYFRVAWDPLPVLVEGLLVGARALGLGDAHRDQHVALLHAILEPAAPDTQPGWAGEDSALTKWSEFTDTLRAIRVPGEMGGIKHLSWRDHLLNLVGARQGQANSVYAINAAALKPWIDRVLESWTIENVTASASNSPELTPFRHAAQTLRKQSATIAATRERLYELQRSLRDKLGEDFDKEALLRALTNVVEVVREAGIAGGLDTKECLRLIEVVRGARVKPALTESAELVPDAPLGTILAVLGKNHTPTLMVCHQLVESFEAFLAAVEERIQNETMHWGDAPLADAIATLTNELSQAVTVLEGVGTHEVA